MLKSLIIIGCLVLFLPCIGHTDLDTYYNLIDPIDIDRLKRDLQDLKDQQDWAEFDSYMREQREQLQQRSEVLEDMNDTMDRIEEKLDELLQEVR